MIYRIRTGLEYTTVNNHFLKNAALSWKAKGLLTYLMSLPDDWQINVRDLTNRSTDGRDGTAGALRELMANGYCQRIRARKDGGKIDGFDYQVCDMPLEPQTEKPSTAKPLTGKPSTENPKQVNTNTTNEPVNKGTKERGNASLFPSLPSLDDELEFYLSPVAEYEVFIAQFKDVTGVVDIEYYYNAVMRWTDKLPRKDKRKYKTARGWIATAKDFMVGDEKDGKLRRLDGATKTPENILNYLSL